jgi:ABC-type antimicrobial peptide transport system permease subunit
MMTGALSWTMIGIMIGAAGAAATTRLLHGLLFQVSDHDPWSATAAVAILLLAAFVAAWIPARRASRIDPIQALRCD